MLLFHRLFLESPSKCLDTKKTVTVVYLLQINQKTTYLYILQCTFMQDTRMRSSRYKGFTLKIHRSNTLKIIRMAISRHQKSLWGMVSYRDLYLISLFCIWCVLICYNSLQISNLCLGRIGIFTSLECKLTSIS